ncbi:MAG: hypothetical protein RLZ63_350 [Pseudomonadota bacterium]|jgi:Ca2+-transporting ATPase
MTTDSPFPAAAALDAHLRETDDLLRQLGSDAHKGLSTAQVQQRLATVRLNALVETGQRHPLRILLAQFGDFMILVLLVAAVIAGLIGEPQDVVAIAVIVVLNALLGFVQEYRAERAMKALKQMMALQARVLREGQVQQIDATQLVPGDVIDLEAGNIVPADVRLLALSSFKVDESTLTGESLVVEKQLSTLQSNDLALGDRLNMAYKGTTVAYGRARGLVVATGMRTELGKIASLLDQEGSKTPLQKRLAAFGQKLSVVVLFICAVLFLAGWLRGEMPMTMLLTAISLAVAAIPEALPAVVTITLALGAARMARHRALIRCLPAVQTLGSVTTICSDKTGTLTMNRMHVDVLQVADGAARREAGKILNLCNDAVIDSHGQWVGDPTETAMLVFTAAQGWAPELDRQQWPRLAEVPFSAERALMSTFHPDESGVLMLVKGAPEAVVPRCTQLWGSTGQAAIDQVALHEQARGLARQGLRVLVLARRSLPVLPTQGPLDAYECELAFCGFVGLIDPPRPQAQEAVAACKAAGIRVVMMTGDHPATAAAIARRLGIMDGHDKVMTGSELQALPLHDFEREVKQVRVYARLNPEQKIKIVKALQDQGELVAMTGDGVNDAPALKRADIGIAMGQGGTDVAREAAHMTLLDDNFVTLVHAVREGRRIYDNIRKFVKFTMPSNAGEIWTLVLASLLALPIPLLPIHLLWINLVTDGLPGLALAGEGVERGVMQRPPRPPQESIFAQGLWQHMVWAGLLMGGLCVLAQAWALEEGSTHWQSMVFTVLTLSQLGHVLAVRSERESLFTQGLLTNKPLLIVVVLSVGLQMAVLYVPWLNTVFKTAPLSAFELLLCFLLAAVLFVAVEIEKLLVRRGWIYKS